MDLSKYLGLFVSEAGEHLAKLGQDLVRVEAAGRAGEPMAELVDEMFRHAHSVKGMAASMEQDGIAQVAHRAEDLLGALRGRREAPRADVVDALLAAVDALQGMVDAAAAGGRPEPDAALLERLAARFDEESGEDGAARDATPKRVQTTFVPPPPEPVPEPAPVPESVPAQKADARRRREVRVVIGPGCPVPAVRAFLVTRKLSLFGELLEVQPSIEDLRAGRIPARRVTIALATEQAPEVLVAALATISELHSVEVDGPAEPRAGIDLAAADGASAPAAAAPSREPERAEGARTVRVKAELLDQFLDALGELILAAARIREVGKTIPEPFRPPLDEGVNRLHATVMDLHDKVMSVRMTPIAAVFDRLPRAARDLARRTGKQVEVEIRGSDIELDRSMLDAIADPLLHVLRNAVDHGLELPEARERAGKPPSGRVEVQARRDRDRVIIEIADDGRGMNADKLRRAAIARGALAESQAASLSETEVWLLACLPGLSTADTVTEVSGRGVGMDAVKRSVEELGGAVTIESAAGAGTRVTLRLPLTVAVQPVLLVRVAEEILALPISKVHGAALVEVERLERRHGAPVLSHHGVVVPVHDLGALLGFGAQAGGLRSVVVADADGARVGFAVDALLGEEEAVMKPLAGPLERIGGLSAVTVLGNGRPVFVLDVQRLVA
ncbi:MAG TPA: chemotaxis protein CheA [Anaeromyxobacteraceae bacterium]|nr:chemotaxis protein CheA [Anaeromyxobacteraceae bacterium]